MSRSSQAVRTPGRSSRSADAAEPDIDPSLVTNRLHLVHAEGQGCPELAADHRPTTYGLARMGLVPSAETAHTANAAAATNATRPMSQWRQRRVLLRVPVFLLKRLQYAAPHDRLAQNALVNEAIEWYLEHLSALRYGFGPWAGRPEQSPPPSRLTWAKALGAVQVYAWRAARVGARMGARHVRTLRALCGY